MVKLMEEPMVQQMIQQQVQQQMQQQMKFEVQSQVQLQLSQFQQMIQQQVQQQLQQHQPQKPNDLQYTLQRSSTFIPSSQPAMQPPLISQPSVSSTYPTYYDSNVQPGLLQNDGLQDMVKGTSTIIDSLTQRKSKAQRHPSG